MIAQWNYLENQIDKSTQYKTYKHGDHIFIEQICICISEMILDLFASLILAHMDCWTNNQVAGKVRCLSAQVLY